MCRAVGGKGWESRGAHWWSVGERGLDWVLGRFACVRVLGLGPVGGHGKERWLGKLAAKARGKGGLVRHVSWHSWMIPDYDSRIL
eukprot:g9901.t1